MSELLYKSLAVVVPFALLVVPCQAQSDEAKRIDEQVKSDTKALSDEQQQLADYQQQAKWYDQFAQQRLQHADIERKQVEARLKLVEETLAKKINKNPNSALNQELNALKGWLADETQKRKQIEATREKWRLAIQSAQSKLSQTKYQIDVDKASLEHQNELDKEKAAREAENPKPSPPQIQQNTILMPGFETEQGTIPTLLGPSQ